MKYSNIKNIFDDIMNARKNDFTSIGCSCINCCFDDFCDCCIEYPLNNELKTTIEK